MSTVAEKPAQKRAAPSKAATKAHAAPTRSDYLDALLRPVAQQIMAMTRIVADSWPWSGEFPARTAILEADGVLMALSITPEEWGQQCDTPRPTARTMLNQLTKLFAQAMQEIEAAVDFDPGQRRLLRLLMREAMLQNNAMAQAFEEAHQHGRDAAMVALAEGAGGEPLTVQKPATVDGDTPITQAGAAAARLALWCSHDIEPLACEVTLLGDECTAEGDSTTGSMLRCYGTRIEQLNSAIMSYLSGDGMLTMRDMQHAHYGGAKHFKPEEVSRG